tara:strand:- start:1104 stop:1367 length:264 start_codon:yes stop_codon:yes gene_type:complete
MTKNSPEWIVYMLRCIDDSLYTGIATDLDRRLAQHNGELVGGARYTSGRRPVVLVYQEICESRSEASIREAKIKKLSRIEKNSLLEI